MASGFESRKSGKWVSFPGSETGSGSVKVTGSAKAGWVWKLVKTTAEKMMVLAVSLSVWIMGLGLVGGCLDEGIWRFEVMGFKVGLRVSFGVGL